MRGDAKDGEVKEVESPGPDPRSTLQETVSLLIKERTDLQGQVVELQRQLGSAKGDTQLLAEGRVLITKLEEDKRELESKLEDAKGAASEVERLEGEVRKLGDESDGLRKESSRLVRSLEEGQTKAAEARRKDLEAMGELEKSVNRARERESGLEAEVARLRQVSELKARLTEVAH